FVYPVLEGDEFEAAFEAYQFTKDSLESCIQRDAVSTTEQELAWNAEMERSATMSPVFRSSPGKILINRLSAGLDQKQAYRSFNLPDLGVVNIDAAITIPVGQQIAVDFVCQESGELIRPEFVQLVEMKERAYYAYFRPEWNEFRFRARKRNMAFGIHPKGELMVAYPEAFEKNFSKEEYNQMALEIVPAELDQFEELVEYIENR
ncbi:MAG: hypothetical protein HKN32_09330, partial [Flavobacteriales bacterium]|nr:hypothetical protein [Flavobacteriales bacterium]